MLNTVVASFTEDQTTKHGTKEKPLVAKQDKGLPSTPRVLGSLKGSLKKRNPLLETRHKRKRNQKSTLKRNEHKNKVVKNSSKKGVSNSEIGMISE